MACPPRFRRHTHSASESVEVTSGGPSHALHKLRNPRDSPKQPGQPKNAGQSELYRRSTGWVVPHQRDGPPCERGEWRPPPPPPAVAFVLATTLRPTTSRWCALHLRATTSSNIHSIIPILPLQVPPLKSTQTHPPPGFCAQRTARKTLSQQQTRTRCRTDARRH